MQPDGFWAHPAQRGRVGAVKTRRAGMGRSCCSPGQGRSQRCTGLTEEGEGHRAVPILLDTPGVQFPGFFPQEFPNTQSLSWFCRTMMPTCNTGLGLKHHRAACFVNFRCFYINFVSFLYTKFIHFYTKYIYLYTFCILSMSF